MKPMNLHARLTRTNHVSVAALLVCIAGVLPGCGATGPKAAPAAPPSSGSQSSATPAQNNYSGALPSGSSVQHAGKAKAVPSALLAVPFDPSDRVAVSSLRERAIAVIESGEGRQARANAVEAAGMHPKRLGKVIQAGLRDPSRPAVQAVAAMTIGQKQLKEFLPLVRPLLTSQSSAVRASAMFAMLRCGQEIDQTPFAEMLLNDPDYGVRSHVAYILGELKNPSALTLLRSAAKEPLRNAAPGTEKSFQIQVSEAMVKLGDDSQLQTIRASLYPSRPEDLEAAALASSILGNLKDRGSADQLYNLIAYRDPQGQRYPAEVLLAVAGSLAHMGNPIGVPVADEFYTSQTFALRSQSAYVYGESGERRYLGVLGLMLEDEVPSVRVAAASAILKLSGN